MIENCFIICFPLAFAMGFLHAAFYLCICATCVASWSMNFGSWPHPTSRLAARRSPSWLESMWSFLEPMFRRPTASNTDALITRPLGRTSVIRKTQQQKSPFLNNYQQHTTPAPYAKNKKSYAAGFSATNSNQPYKFLGPYRQQPTAFRAAVKTPTNIPLSFYGDTASLPLQQNTPLGKEIVLAIQGVQRRQAGYSNTCAKKRYAKPLKCPKTAEFTQLGKSCYFVSSLTTRRVFTLEESRHQCSQLNDLTGQSAGDWHLAAINNVEEFNALSAASDSWSITHDVNETAAARYLWIAQVQPVSSADDAYRLNSPYLYNEPCAGVAPFSAPINTMSPSQLTDLLHAPIGCNLLTNVQRATGMAQDCRQTRLNFLCELDLDGNPSTFQANGETSLMARKTDTTLLGRRSALNLWRMGTYRQRPLVRVVHPFG